MPEQSASLAGSMVTVEQDGWQVVSATPQVSEETIRTALSSPPTEETPSASPPQEEAEAAPSPSATEPTEAAAPQEPDSKPPKKERAAERIKRLRAEIAAAARERRAVQEALARERAELERLRQARERGASEGPSSATPSPPSPSRTAPASPDVPAAEDPRPTWEQFEAEGKSWDEYEAARDAWYERRVARLVEERQRAWEQERESRTRVQSVVQAHEQRVQQMLEQHPEFLDVVTERLSDIPRTPLLEETIVAHPKGVELLWQLAQQPEVARQLATLTEQATPEIRDAVLASTDPAALLFHFAEHPETYDQLRQMDRTAALLALGSLMTYLTSGRATSTGSLRGSRTSSAPRPIQPVGGARTADDSDVADLMSLPFERYVQRVNELERKGRRPW